MLWSFKNSGLELGKGKSTTDYEVILNLFILNCDQVLKKKNIPNSVLQKTECILE